MSKLTNKAFVSYSYMMIDVGAGVSFGCLASLATVWAHIELPEKGILYCLHNMGTAILCFLLGSSSNKPEPKVVNNPMVSIIFQYMSRFFGTVCGFFALVGWLPIPVYLVLNLLGSVIPEDASIQMTSWA